MNVLSFSAVALLSTVAFGAQANPYIGQSLVCEARNLDNQYESPFTIWAFTNNEVITKSRFVLKPDSYDLTRVGTYEYVLSDNVAILDRDNVRERIDLNGMRWLRELGNALNIEGNCTLKAEPELADLVASETERLNILMAEAIADALSKDRVEGTLVCTRPYKRFGTFYGVLNFTTDGKVSTVLFGDDVLARPVRYPAQEYRSDFAYIYADVPMKHPETGRAEIGVVKINRFDLNKVEVTNSWGETDWMGACSVPDFEGSQEEGLELDRLNYFVLERLDALDDRQF